MRTASAGIPLYHCAKRFGMTAHRLRQFLQGRNAIAPSQFGWTGTPAFHERGLIYTQARQHSIATDRGYIQKHYTVVLITGAGVAWLQQQLPQSTKTKTAPGGAS